ncbi:thiamine biosynthesis protein ThiF [Coxiella endosymbiont of Amblyomma sculptum]|uniref:HesA/MoeB/ThiF family protein n=1 Tax=Coxiella endosymbiont of Amblyomma sculptum TaxID=2487929 RepID=UPI00132ED231|nr:HesA/MoeB/ThiF family protein [Coxiella endosymbiont of Amblyomma sculptum]QHG92233.1 thiamine biosynthesis protein ThiF [Coxiella endosymbiont of Amblyomma sculptum]
MKLIPIDDAQRYACSLPLIGKEGQVRLFNACVLCVGAGGLGVPVLQYLAATGIGTLGIVDNDQIEISNLQRQVIFTPDDIGKNKAVQAKRYLNRFNPSLQIIAYSSSLGRDNIEKIVHDFEIVIDCTDNNRTRHLVNNICVQRKKPLIFASVYQFQGQCSVFNYRDGPCYNCLYENPFLPEETSSNNCTYGVLGTVTGILGCIQATEAIKILLEKEEVLSGRLLTIDVSSMKTKEFLIPKNSQCFCCSKNKTPSKSRSNKSSLEGKNKVQTQIQEVEAKKLFQWLERLQSDILLVDVRESYERAICHIGGLHIPLHRLNTSLEILPRDKFIVCYCKSGRRSRSAAQFLKSNGFSRVSSLYGGILSWIHYIDSSLTSY